MILSDEVGPLLLSSLIIKYMVNATKYLLLQELDRMFHCHAYSLTSQHLKFKVLYSAAPN